MELSFLSRGTPTDPALLLIPGLGMPAVAWPEDFVSLLVSGGYRVIALDNRDCAASPVGSDQAVSGGEVLLAVARRLAGFRVRAPYRLEDMADDALALLDRLELARAHVVGISLGGMIAQCLALRAPDRVATLTCLCSASGNARRGLGRLRAVMAALPRPGPLRAAADRRRLARHVMATIGTPGERYEDAYLDRLAEAVERQPSPGLGAARQLLAMLASGDRGPELRRLRVPTLVVHGLSDPLLPPEAGRDLAESIPGAAFLGLPGMGHDLPAARRPEIARAILEHCAARR